MFSYTQTDKLQKVRSLTLRSPQKTTHRRVSAIPQLKCLSNPALCKLADITTMRCTNEGSSYDSGTPPALLPYHNRVLY